jgi:hypothetical protein
VVVTLHPNARPGNTNALKNGARSPARIAAKARAHRRRFLRRAGIRAGDLDAVALELLNLYARSCCPGSARGRPQPQLRRSALQ